MLDPTIRGSILAWCLTAISWPALAWAQTSVSVPSVQTLLHAPRLTDLDTALAYAKMTGTTPDFRAYGEHAAAYQAASAFQKDAVLTHLVRAYGAEFDSLSLSRAYSLTVNLTLQQFDAARGGYPIDFDEQHFIPIRDPAASTTYDITFSNIDSFDLIPMGNEAAQDFAARFNLDTHSPYAGFVLFQIAFRLEDAPPATDANSTTIRAHILAARIVNATGQVLHSFPLDQAPASAETAGHPTISRPEPLKSASVEGLGLGMPHADALAVAHKAFTGFSQESPSFDAYFDGARGGIVPTCGHAPPARNWAASGGWGMAQENDKPGDFSDCLSFDVASNAVSAIHSIQFLPDTTRAAVMHALTDKYGPPIYTARDSTQDDAKWIGRDGSGLIVEIDGTLISIAHVIELRVDAHPWADPHAKAVTPPTITAPKL